MLVKLAIMPAGIVYYAREQVTLRDVPYYIRVEKSELTMRVCDV